jgi:peptidoglycan/LPS O-acetylase OafA/YrhL
MQPMPKHKNRDSKGIKSLWRGPGAEPLVSTKHVGVLDGVRALCVFFVAWFHVWQQSWLTPSVTLFGEKISLDFVVRSGYIFVDGLILLSGFLLFLPYARCKAEGAPMPSMREFYVKRVMRIIPSYYFSVLIMLFFVAIPQGRYSSLPALIQDVLMHLTFTHTLSAATYLQTPLNGALWTLGVEMHAYLAFPLLALGFMKKPYLTASLMMGAAFLYRGLTQVYVTDTSMWFNQFPAFLDVYAIGMLAAFFYVALAKKFPRPRVWLRMAATVIACSAVYAVILLMKSQAASNGYEAIRLSQMNQRFFLAVALAAFMLGLAFAFKGVRIVFANPVMKFLSAISFNYYIWHQVLAVWLKEWHIPPYKAQYPNMAGEQPWQVLYTLACFGLAILLASALTFGLEKPAAALVHKLLHRRPKTNERPADDTIGA